MGLGAGSEQSADRLMAVRLLAGSCGSWGCAVPGGSVRGKFGLEGVCVCVCVFFPDSLFVFLLVRVWGKQENLYLLYFWRKSSRF